MLIIIIGFSASALLTALVHQHMLSRSILDIPNGRSSHSVPTPRGGGLSIVVIFLLTVLLLVHRGAISTSLGSAIGGGGLAVALTGFLDDCFRVSAWLRLLIHFAAAGWALWWLGGVAPLHLGWIVWEWGWVGNLIAIFGLVWMINLYNFMDGIDGLAGMEAVSASAFAGLLLARSGLEGLSLGALALAAASGGFLLWNWPPAKIFMGDVGSGFLGFVFAVLALSSAKEHPWLLWPWLILLSVFIVDASLTLLQHFFMGVRCWQAHCTHAYQHAARRCASHLKVTLTVAAVNVLWLFPLAWGACVWPALGPLFAIVALAPLVYTAFRNSAGKDSSASQALTSQTDVRMPASSLV